MGLRSPSVSMIAPGRKSKTSWQYPTAGCPELYRCPCVHEHGDGCATPMAYASSISHSDASPAATMFLRRNAPYMRRICRLSWAFEKEPPPCAARPPYVSAMIFRPVRPESRQGRP